MSAYAGEVSLDEFVETLTQEIHQRLARLPAVLQQLQGATMQVDAAAETIKQPYFAALLGEHLERAHVRSQSPWVSREDAAAYAGGISLTSVDIAASAGIIRRYPIGTRVLFKKSEIDAAIQSGNWPTQNKKAA